MGPYKTICNKTISTLLCFLAGELEGCREQNSSHLLKRCNVNVTPWQAKRHHTYTKRVLDGSVEEVYQKEGNGLAVKYQERVNGNKIIMI